MFPQVRPDINPLRVMQEQFENQETECRIRCAALDTVQRETVALVVGIALAQLEVIDELLTGPERNFESAREKLRSKLELIATDSMEDFKTLIDARDHYIQDGQVVKLTPSIKENILLPQFRTLLDEIFRKSEKELSPKKEEDLVRLKAIFEERIRVKGEIAEHILEGKTRITNRMYTLIDERNKCASMRQHILEKPPTDIWTACEVGAVDVLSKEIASQWFFRKKTFVNTPNTAGLPPLHIAAFHAHLTAVELLLKHGANPLGKNKEGYSALHWAAKAGAVPVMHRLFGLKVPLDIRGEYQRTPLHLSVYNSRAQATIFLLNNGADINAKTSLEDNSKTPLHDAVIHQDEVMVGILIKYSSLDVMCTDRLGWTPLRHAVLDGSLLIATLLIQHDSWKIPADPKDPNHFIQMMEINPKNHKGEIQKLLQDFYLGSKQFQAPEVLEQASFSEAPLLSAALAASV